MAMGKFYVGGEYFLILWNYCITKPQITVAEKVDENHEAGVISGCAVAGYVWYKEGRGGNFIHFVEDRFSKYFGLESSGKNIMINAIGG